MDFKIDKKNGYAVVATTTTRLNTTNAPDLKSELVVLNGEGFNKIIIDLSSCEYCDSSGLSAILVANRLCEQTEGCFILTGLQSDVENLIKISLLDTILSITESIEDAETLIQE